MRLCLLPCKGWVRGNGDGEEWGGGGERVETMVPVAMITCRRMHQQGTQTKPVHFGLLLLVSVLLLQRQHCLPLLPNCHPEGGCI